MKEYLGQNIPKLGFGMMRLPLKDQEIDLEQVKVMADKFIEAGFIYFDTAYGYMNGKSEIALREAVVKYHPRETFLVADKFPSWAAHEKADVQKIFDEQLTKTGAGYFDFYLIHAIHYENLGKLDELGVWEFMKEQKAKGTAKHIGFSYHDTAEHLDEILTNHPEVEFVQLQINYIDWDNEGVQSRLCHEVCMKHGKPMVIMEPVKGGSLVNIAPEALKLLKDAAPEASAASWAIRYCASLEGIITVLSGMSNIEQMEDNLSYMKNFKALDCCEKEVIGKVVETLNALPTIPCTACNYCIEQCPQNIPIPKIMSLLNQATLYGAEGRKGSYKNIVEETGKASDCLQCGVCQGRCPQHIGIIENLKKAVELFENE